MISPSVNSNRPTPPAGHGVLMTEQLERYNPINPLPDEIRTLPVDETVCKFCGVSYLIHNEIKKLEHELESVRAQLEGYLEMKDKFSSVEAENRELRENLERSRELGVKQAKVIDQLTGDLNEKSRQLEAVSGDYATLSEKFEGQVALVKKQAGKLSNFEKTTRFYPPLAKQISHIKENKLQCEQEIQGIKDMFSGNVKNLSQYLQQLSAKCEESEARLTESLREVSSFKSQISSLTNEKSVQAEQIAQQQDKLSVLESSTSSLDHVQKQNVQLSKMISGTQKEVESFRNNLAVSDAENVKLKQIVSVKGEENVELKQRLKDLTKRHTTQIEDLNKKYHSSIEMQSSLKNKIIDHVQDMVKDKETIALQSTKLEKENGQLRGELSQLTNDLSDIEERTRGLAESHRLQLSDLHASYQDQLNNAVKKSENFKGEINKLQTLKKQQDAEMVKIAGNVNTKHDSQIRDIENSYKQSQHALEKQIDKLSAQYSKDLQDKEHSIRDIEKSFAMKFENMTSEKGSLSNTIAQLNKQIDGYETTIKQLECKAPEPADDTDALKSVKSRNSQLENEVLTLQRIVQKECEERKELTEHLDKLKYLINSDNKVRENSQVSSRTSTGSNSVQTLPKIRSKTESNQNSNNSKKKKMPNKYASWIKK